MTSHRDNYAELTALFTTSDSLEPDNTDAPIPEIVVPQIPRIECIVPGHLPVRAGGWFLPCARHLAGEAHSGVLMQLESDQADVTAFGTNGASGNRSALLEGLAQQSRRWFLLPSHETSPAEYPLFGVDRITVLTGADQAAVVAAYQTIKSIVSGSGAEASRLNLGLFIAGSPQSQAEETADRLMHTVQRQLGCEMTFRGSMHQVGAVSGGLHRMCIDVADGPVGLVADVRRAISAAAAMTAGEPAPLTVPPPLAVAAEESPPEEAFSEALQQEPASPSAAPLGVVVAEPAETADTVHETDGQESLSCCIDGLTLLPVRCPHHIEVEVACDAHGVLQAVAMADALPELMAVQAWLRSHMEPVDMACPEAGLDTKSAPRIQVCTDDARSVMSLLDAEVELHLLVTIDLEGRSVRCSTPLS